MKFFLGGHEPVFVLARTMKSAWEKYIGLTRFYPATSGGPCVSVRLDSGGKRTLNMASLYCRQREGIDEHLRQNK